MMKTKKGRARRFLSILLAVIMVLSMIPANGSALAAYAEEGQTSGTSADETESGISGLETDALKETESSEESRDVSETTDAAGTQSEATESETAGTESQNDKETAAETEKSGELHIDTSSLPDSGELFEGYVMKKFYGDNGISLYGNYGETRLSGNDLAVYNKLKEKIASVANGQESSTEFPIDVSDKEIYYTNGQLSGLDVNLVIRTLLADCPYELYWYDKSGEGARTSWNYDPSSGKLAELQISFSVAEAYKGSEAYTVDTAKTGAASKAASKAQEIVSANAGKSDHEKLAAYRNAICSLVSYDHDAAAGTGASGSDPWQLIYVFDDNPSTNVVCEGYSKAFQYLCDMGGLTCYSVSGTMKGGTGEGAHMWNIVVLDGQSYLVDVTNCDEGTVGAYGGLFLVGAPDGTADGYTIHIPSNDLGNGTSTVPADISYTYNANTISLYSAEIRTLAKSNYMENEPEPGIVATVEKGGEVKSFTDIDEAWTEAKKGTDASPATLTLLESVDLDTKYLTMSSGNIILEMADGVRLVGNINGNYYGVILVQGGTLTMKSGIVENTYSYNSESDNTSNYGVGVHVAGTGTFNMAGGQVLATGRANEAGIKIRNNSNATVNITGGTVSGTYCGVEIKNGGILSISGDASVSCTSDTGMGVYCFASDSAYSATVNIYGGTITGGSGANSYGINLGANNAGKVVKGAISGGNISGIKVSGADVGLDITGGTIDGGVLAAESCSVNLSNCTVNGRTTGRDQHGISVSDGAEVNINSGVNIHTTTFESYGIYVNRYGGIVNIYEGATVEASDDSFYSVYIYGADSTVNIYGGSFISNNRGGVCSENGAKVNLYGGTFYYSGTWTKGGAVRNANTNGTVKDLLADGYAYYDGTEVKAEQLIAEGLDGQKLTQKTVTVGACSHIDTDSDGICDICGNEMPVATVSMNGVVTEFDDINAAWTEALKGTDEAPATLTLMKSVDLNGSKLEIPLNNNANIILEMAENVELTSSLEGARSGNGVIKINGGTLTMKSGIVKNPYSYDGGASDIYYGVGVYVTRTGTFNMEGGQVLATGNANAAGIRIGNDVSVKVNISGGTVSGTYSGVEAKSNNSSVVNVSDNAHISCTAENGKGIFFYGSMRGGSSLNVTGGTITGGSGTDGRGISMSYVSATITGGTISGIDVVSSDNVDISGATIDGTVSVHGGRADLSNCVINARTTGTDQHGIIVSGGAEVNVNSGVDIHTTAETSYGIYASEYDGGTVNIYDGVTVDAGGSASCGVYISGERNTANIYGGSFTSNGRWTLNCWNGTVNLYGGTFYYNGTWTKGSTVRNANTNGTVKDLLAEGYAYYEGETADAEQAITEGLGGTELKQKIVTVGECSHIDADNDGTCDACGKVSPIATVAINDEVTEFVNINDAWAKALEGTDESPATLTLLKSIDMGESNLVLNSNSNIVLEMNEGVTLSSSVGINFGDKEGVIQMKAGTLTVNSGTISNYRTGSAYSYGIVVEGTAANTANLYIKGSAEIISEYEAVYSNRYSRIEVADNAVITGSSKHAALFVYGELIVNGGEINGGMAICAWERWKNVIINGGTITGQTMGIYALSGGKVTVNGGTIKAEGTNVPSGIYVYGDDTEVEITGGYIEGKSRGVLIHSGHLSISGDAVIYGGNTGVSDYIKGNSTGTGTVTISGADISGKTFGVVIQDPDTGWEISGGNISGLCGVYLKNGNPDISGGTIDASDCGIYVFSNSGINLSGSPSIAGETMGDVYLLCESDGSAEAKINIAGALNLSEPIGVTKCDSQDDNTTYGGIFTSGWSASGNTDPIASYFVSGDSKYSVELDEEAQELYLNDKISLADAAVTVAEGPYVYNGKEHTPEVTVTLNGQILTKDTDYTVTYSDNIGAGTATVTVTGTGEYGRTESAVFTIEKADPVIGDVSYDGTIYPSTPVESVTLKRSDESIPGALALAEDSVFIEGESEYRWTFTPDDTANYSTINGTVSLTVTKDTLVKLEAEGEPDKKDYIYEDTFEANGLTIKAVYASGHTEDVTNEVTASELKVGDTEVILSYTDGEGATANCTIGGITVSKKVLDNTGINWSVASYTYDGTEQGPDLTGNLPEGVKVTESGNKETDAGSYRAEAVFGLAEGYSSENYALAVENLPAEWSIGRRSVTVTPDSGLSKSYGQADPTFTYSADNMVEGEELSGVLSREPGEDMGDYRITRGSLTDDNNKNYTINFVEDVTFAILEKSIADADVSVSGEFVYNGGEHRPVPTVTLDDKVLTENVDYTVSYENNINAGEAAVVISGSGNYGGEARESFIIARKEITAVVTAEDKTYDGSAEAVVTATAGTGIDGEELIISGLTGSFEDANAGTDKKVTVDASGVEYFGNADPNNYQVSFGDAAADIYPAAMTAVGEGYTGVYDGEGHGITVMPSETDAVVRYGETEGDYGHDSLTYKDAGTYVVYYQVTKDNYETATGSATVEIARRPVTISGINAEGKTYDKTDAAILNFDNVVYDGIIGGDGLTISANGRFEDVNAGENKTVNITALTLDGPSVKNYVLAEEGQQTMTAASITPKEITVTITPNGGVYNGTILPATAAANDVIDGDDAAVTLTYTGKANDETDVDSEAYPTKAGTYTVTASITNGNYRLIGETTAQFVVDKAEAGLAVSMVADKTYGDGGFKLDVTRNSDSNLTYESSDTSVLVVDENGWVQIVGAGKATLTVTDEGNANYYGDSKDVTITVDKKNGTLTVVDFTYENVVYGDADFRIGDIVSEGESSVQYESSDPAVVTVDENGQVNIVGAGKAVITLTMAESGNYYAADTTVTITVLPKSVTVTADSQTKVYGEKDAELTWKAEGLVDEDKLEGITVTRKDGETVGEYPITASQSDGMNPNYNVIFVDGSLTIQARDIADAKVDLGAALIANGKTQTQEIRKVSVKNSDGEEMEVTYTVAGNQATEPGAYTMTLTGTGNFTGTVTKTFVIAPAADSKVDTDINGDVVIGEGTIGIRVEEDEKAPEAEIRTDQKTLIEMLTENGDLTAEELSQTAEGADIRLILKVTGADGAVSEESRVQIEKAVSGYTIGQYVNVQLFKEISREGEVLNTVQLRETRDNIEISVKVPENLLNKDKSVTRTFYIVRYYEGKVEFLPAVYDEAENALIFETNKFADYAIVYKDVKNPTDNKPGNNSTNKPNGNGKKPMNTATGTAPKTGDSMNLGLWLAVMIGSCGIVIGSVVYGKRKKKQVK